MEEGFRKLEEIAQHISKVNENRDWNRATVPKRLANSSRGLDTTAGASGFATLYAKNWNH